MVNIIKNLVNKDKYSIKCPFSMIPSRIVVHNTANCASAKNEINYMINNNNEVSYHYAVDDKEIVQGIEENRSAWHCGDGNGIGNLSGIAIEICYSTCDIDKFLKAESNAIDLIVDIMKRYNFTIDKVTKHQDYSGKYCPHKTLDLGWDRFINLIRDRLNDSKPFNIGDIVYNIDDVKLTETAGYGGQSMILNKNSESIVKLYHYNKELYFALGTKDSYYTSAWTKEFDKFTKTKPIIDDNIDNGILNNTLNDNKLIDIIKFILNLLYKIVHLIIKLFKK